MTSGSKKHKKPSDNINVATTQGCLKAKLGACARCKIAKSYCELDDRASTCISYFHLPKIILVMQMLQVLWTLQATLYFIPEANNSDMLLRKAPRSFSVQWMIGVMLFELKTESEDYEQDIAAISSMSSTDLSSESSGTDDVFLQSSLLLPPPPAMKKKVRFTSMSREGTSTQVYTAQTFIIQYVIHRLNSTNSPFKVPSQIAYDQLWMLVAGKLKCYPGTLKLQYWLDSNHAKHAAISIQSEELVLFKAGKLQCWNPNEAHHHQEL
ncbi:hypothetical protein HD554DRAFT_2036422 [Boletus coccyginus]|nr:hypothetical protein HD554DRAFT_2036422 [Boletus coccyginus]